MKGIKKKALEREPFFFVQEWYSEFTIWAVTLLCQVPESSNMKVLVLPYTHTLSHLSRPLAVALELRKMGHEVIFGGDSPKIPLIVQQGFDVVPCYEPDPEMLYGNIRSGKIRFVEDSEIDRMITADLDAIRAINPDLVLSDGRFSAPLSTHIAKVPHAAIVNVSSTEYRAIPYVPFFEWIPPWLVQRDSEVWKALDRTNLRLEMILFDKVMNVFSKLSREYKISRPVSATNCLAGKDITLLADIPEYFPTRNLPPSYHYVGPLTWKNDMLMPSWWPLPKSTNRLIYITMGTTGVASFFGALKTLLSSAPFMTVISTGGIPVALENIPGRIYAESYLDGDLVMEQCDLVICHGGNGTIYQALSHGKPIIGIPTIPDQSFNMRRVKALGVGETVTWRSFEQNPSVVLEAIHSITSNKTIGQNCRKMQAILAKYDAPRLAAEILHENMSK